MSAQVEHHRRDLAYATPDELLERVEKLTAKVRARQAELTAAEAEQRAVLMADLNAGYDTRAAVVEAELVEPKGDSGDDAPQREVGGTG